MPHGKQNKKNASGNGTIRKKTIVKKGKQYIYWEARATVGYDPGTGKQIQRSITAKTQKEAAQKLKELTLEVDRGTYLPPSKITVGEWMDTWSREYLGGVKPRTVENYLSNIEKHINPALGAVRLETLTAPQIQGFYNDLLKPSEKRGDALSPKTVKLVHGVLHKALQQAVSIGYLRFNPSDACILPRVERKELQPLNEDEIACFISAVEGHRFAFIYLVTLFTGLRKGEVLGLTWDRVDFSRGTILINQQLQKYKDANGNAAYQLVTTKSGKGRKLTPAPYVMNLLRRQRAKQTEYQLMAGSSWQETGYVFTDELGDHLKLPTVYHNFKKIAAAIGRPELRFHDLRHPYVKPTTQIF